MRPFVLDQKLGGCGLSVVGHQALEDPQLVGTEQGANLTVGVVDAEPVTDDGPKGGEGRWQRVAERPIEIEDDPPQAHEAARPNPAEKTALNTMDDFYKDYILDHYRNPRNYGHLDAPDASAEDLNPLCGDQIRVELKVDGGRVADVRFSGRGCAISQAAMSMLTESVRGLTLEEVARYSKERVLENVGIGISPARMKCALLGLKVLRSAALGEIASWPDEAPAPQAG